jgi:phosphoenolpyruvate carboxylase
MRCRRARQYQQLLPQVQSRPRHADMPYRLLNDRMRARLQATLDDGEAPTPAGRMIDDLQLILDSLRATVASTLVALPCSACCGG